MISMDEYESEIRQVRNLILLSNKEQIKKVGKILRTHEYVQIILLDSTLKSQFRELYSNIDCIYFKDILDNPVSWVEYSESAKRVVDRWYNIKVNNKNLFEDILSYSGISVLKAYEINHTFNLSDTSALPYIIEKVHIFDALIKKINAERLFLLGPFTDWEIIIKTYCEQHSIEYVEVAANRDKLSNRLRQQMFTRKVNILGSHFILYLPKLTMRWLLATRDYIQCLRNRSDIKRDDVAPKVALFGMNKKYLDLIIPVLRTIEEDGKYEALALVPANFDGEKILRENNIAYERINDYLTFNIIREASQIASNIYRKWKRIRNDEKLANAAYYYNDMELTQLILPQIEKMFVECYQLFKPALIMKRIVELRNVKALVMCNWQEVLSAGLVEGARLAGIKSVGIKRGLTLDCPEMSILPLDKLAVSGNYVKNIFQNRGVEPEKVEVTGTPIFNTLLEKLSKKEEIRTKICGHLKIGHNDKIICYTTQGVTITYELKDKISETRAIFEAVKKLPDAFLIVKVHPSEMDFSFYKEINSSINLSKIAYIKDELPLDELIISSDILITKHSTTGLDAVIAGIPLFIVDFKSGDFESYPYVSSGVALSAYTEDEVYSKLKSLLESKRTVLSEEDREKFIAEHLYKLDAKSEQRIRNIIYKLAEGTS